MVAKAKLRIEGEDATAAAWRKATGTAQSASKRIGDLYKVAFAGFSAAALVGIGRDAIKLGDDLNKAAIKAGITGRAMSELNYVAKQSDIDLTSLSSAIKKMQVNLSEAATGGKAQNETLKALGLTIKDLQGLDADKQFEVLGDRISQLTDPADRARAAVELFGKAGADLLPLFADGAKGIASLRAEAVKLGASLSNEQIKALADADTAVKKLDASWDHFWAKMMARAGNGGVTDFLNSLSGVIPDEQRIRSLEEELRLTADRPWTKDKRASIQRDLDFYRLRQEATTAPNLGGRGHGNGQAPPGFTDTAAAEAARKATAAQDKAAEAQIDRWDKMFSEYDRDFSESSDKILQDNLEREGKRMDAADDFYRTMMENEKKLGDYRDEQAHKLTENQQVLKDGFLNAWDDMVNNGKFKIDELFKYVIAEFARRGIAKLFDSMFMGGGGGGLMPGGKVSGGGPWGWLSKIGGVLGGIFGFADGGDPPAGVPYMVGERGPEVRINRGPGTIIPNHALGGSTVIAPHYNIDARGATQEFAKLLPKILRENNASLEALIVGKIQRNAYPGIG